MIQLSQPIIFAQECYLTCFNHRLYGDEGSVCLPAQAGSGLAQNMMLVSGPIPSFAGLASETDPILSDSSPAFTEAGSETQGAVSLAHTLLFGCLWQQDPNKLDMCLYKKKKRLGMGPKEGVRGC